jgi:hypothetical protein
MPEMWQRTADTNSEIRVETGAAVLGMLGFPQVPDDAESLRDKTMKRSRSPGQKINLPPFSVELMAGYGAGIAR